MINLPDNILTEIYIHIEQSLPREACGLLVSVQGKYKYFPCRNTAENNLDFILDPNDWVKAEDAGNIMAVVHSHPFLSPQATEADLVGCERSGLPWIIINWPNKTSSYLEPTGYKAPLEGRPYSYGTLDCVTILQDYYKELLNIKIYVPQDRPESWWQNGGNLYLENTLNNGFYRVETPQLHDVLLMAMGNTKHPNHAAIWVGDNRILHHPRGKLSSINIYGGWYRKVTTHIFRHKDVKL